MYAACVWMDGGGGGVKPQILCIQIERGGLHSRQNAYVTNGRPPFKKMCYKAQGNQ